MDFQDQKNVVLSGIIDFKEIWDSKYFRNYQTSLYIDRSCVMRTIESASDIRDIIIYIRRMFYGNIPTFRHSEGIRHTIAHCLYLILYKRIDNMIFVNTYLHPKLILETILGKIKK